MRCRKVRSLLSATSFNDEIPGRQSLAVREHLSTCPDCRKEASLLESLKNAGQEMPSLSVPGDFNVKLLNRLAQVRYTETRTKAYLPKHAPVFGWRRLVPVVATFVLVLAFAGLGDFTLPDNSPTVLSVQNSGQVDNSYLTIQPVNNPNLSSALNSNWSFQDQFANSERISRYSRNLLNGSSFGASHLTSFVSQPMVTPDHSVTVIRMRQVSPQFRVFRVVTTPARGAVTKVY